MKNNYKLAIVGSTGLVGSTVKKVLEERKLPIKNFTFFSSKRSAGKVIDFLGNSYTIQELKENSFDSGFDFAIFCAGGDISKQYVPIATSKGCTVIDNSSIYRMDKNVPLVVPEVNSEDISWNNGIIANPNCSTIQAVVALKPLNDKYKIKRIVYSTYQSVSGAGMNGYIDLENGIKNIPPQKFPHPIFCNCIPHIDVFLDNGYTKEEEKMINETRKILHSPSLNITATTVRVPVFYCHSESINVEFENDFILEELVDCLEKQPGIIIQDDVKNNIYPMALTAQDKDDVYVGRIRRDFSIPSGVNLWVVSDNVRKGAATNAVQILECLINN